MYRQMKYEVLEKQFSEGDVIHNFNGNDYLIICKFNRTTFLLMDIKSTDYVVGIGVNYLVRYPKLEERNEDNEEYGIEWNHGRYLGKDLCEVDLRKLKEEFSDTDRDSGTEVKAEYTVEIEEYLSRTVKIMASSYEEAEQKVREMYDSEDIVLDYNDLKEVNYREIKYCSFNEEKSSTSCIR